MQAKHVLNVTEKVYERIMSEKKDLQQKNGRAISVDETIRKLLQIE